MASDMPAAIVSRGTLTDQQVIIGTLTSLPEKIAGMEVAAPSLLIIGSVVSLHPRYRWFM
jgi:uroporphyrin-III C-methyltransferase/precorrin-2 dehydrogenase/sirohydrochlorin ferrochelatase